MGYLRNHSLTKKFTVLANSFPSKSSFPWILSPAKMITYRDIHEKNMLKCPAILVKSLLASGTLTIYVEKENKTK